MGAEKVASESEIQLCDRIRDWAERLGFEVYPEVNGWDLVLVARAPVLRLDRVHTVATGQQVGIHAKLRSNCDVIAQAMPPPTNGTGWRYPALPFVAAPNPGDGFRSVCRRLGLGVIATEGRRRRYRWPGHVSEPQDPFVDWWPEYSGEHPQLGLPPIASKLIVAGAPSPRTLSEWRVKALRFLAFARKRETFTKADLTSFGLGGSWVDRWGEPVDWITVTRRGKTVRVRIYKLTEHVELLPDAGYRDVAEELWAAEQAPVPTAAAGP